MSASEVLAWITMRLSCGLGIDPIWWLAPECSGLNGVIAITLLCGFLCLSRALRWAQRCLLLAIALLLAIVQNVARVMILVGMADHLQRDAWCLLHSVIGYITAGTAILLLIKICDTMVFKNKTNKRR